jgi:hypothetical protein
MSATTQPDYPPTGPQQLLSLPFRRRISLSFPRHTAIGEANVIPGSFCSDVHLSEKDMFSLQNLRILSLPIPIDSINRPLPSKSRFGLERALTSADKQTRKWPRPRSSLSAAPWLCSTKPFSHRSVRHSELRGAGWSQSHMEAVLRDGQGLAVNWVGQWTLHKWCLLASVTTIFLLGLSCLVFSFLIWFAGKSSIQYACLCGCDSLLYLTSTAYPAAPVLLITDPPALVLLTFSSSLFSSLHW